MQGLSPANLWAWAAQVVVIASLGAVLPFVFRIRHSKSRLFYCHAVLMACFILPLLQPWQQVLVLSARVSPASASPTEQVFWGVMAFWIIVLGMAVRLFWLAMGLWQVRCFREGSFRLHPTPESIRSARKLAGADAQFRLSRNVGSPATLGHVDPVVLLPESFLSLDAEAQQSVAVHELLHVRRRDWLVTIVEEFANSIFWFNPGIWWLVAQARLSREQLVDAEVVGLTRATAPYIEALLSIAGFSTSKKTGVALAAPFFRKRHLPTRVEALLTPRNGSSLHLVFSYGLIAIILTAGVLSSLTWFPFFREAEVFVLASSPPGLPVPQFVSGLEKHAFAPILPMEFTIKVLPPPDVVSETAFAHETVQDIVYYVHRPFPVPPSLAGFDAGFGVSGLLALRAIRPGTVVEPAEIERLLASIPAGQRVEVTQDPRNVITRIVVTREELRRFADEVHAIPFDVPPGPVDANTAAPSGTTNGVD